MTWAIVVAIAGALAVATGAALQERTARTAPSIGINQLRLLGHLVRSPRWLLGTALTFSGVGAHMWALSQAPLTVVQPIGVSGLLFAVMLAAFLRKRRLTRAQIGGCLAVTAGLAALLTVLPDHPGDPALSRSALVCMPVVCAVIMLGCLALARCVGDAARACALALAGGVGFGVTSALARIIGVAALQDPAALLRPLTLVALALGLSGALLVQNAYRTDHFALAYATLLISDPLAAAAIGVAVFAEPLPADPAAAAVVVLAAFAGALGVVTLARSSGPKAAPARSGVGRGPVAGSSISERAFRF
ncbi:drug/metabolite transporter (DMT)-like permease [Spinactinospora alkalitolerans]|uniref:Drug/metabolite transporter (DMT)-like permease n=1 Tax=Spinactinospora alkalitolerans TaxID=687207 RepID=A0A852TPX2_9ACTN|nr:DMT family transporter [Spinactinospora alkalitolerans]NYE45327.1 drug/metabolite transporter (DMT)-like permease [Spinactinospora alkalitolerans]